MHIIVTAKRPWRQCLGRAVWGNDTSLFSALLVTVKECRTEWIRGIWSRENSMLSHSAIVNTSLLGGLHSFSWREEVIRSLWVSEEAAGVRGVVLGTVSSSLFTVALKREHLKVTSEIVWEWRETNNYILQLIFEIITPAEGSGDMRKYFYLFKSQKKNCDFKLCSQLRHTAFNLIWCFLFRDHRVAMQLVHFSISK